MGEFSFEIELGSAFLSNLLTVVSSIANRTFFSGEVRKNSDFDLEGGSACDIFNEDFSFLMGGADGRLIGLSETLLVKLAWGNDSLAFDGDSVAVAVAVADSITMM